MNNAAVREYCLAYSSSNNIRKCTWSKEGACEQQDKLRVHQLPNSEYNRRPTSSFAFHQKMMVDSKLNNP